MGWSIVRLVISRSFDGLVGPFDERFIVWFLGWSGGQPVGDLLGRSDGLLVGLSFIQLVGCSVCLSVIHAVVYFAWSRSRWFDRSVVWLADWLVGGLVAGLVEGFQPRRDHEGTPLIHLPLLKKSSNHFT